MGAIQNGLIWRVGAGLLLFGSSLLAADLSNDAFFPMAKGDRWVYDTLNKKGKDRCVMTVVIEGPWKEKNASGMRMTQKDHRGTMREYLVHNEKGIFIHKLGVSQALTPEVYTRFTPAVPRVIFPLTAGTTVHWEGNLKIAWVNIPIIFDGEVVGWEDVDVPAGRFHAIKLHYHEKRGKEVLDEHSWYAEGVGQVKYDGGQYIKELKSYQPYR